MMNCCVLISSLLLLSLTLTSTVGGHTKRGWGKKKSSESYSSSDIRPPPECPKGAIFLWFGSIKNIPDGFRICDGEKGTPDLRDSFAIGAGDKFPFGSTGGVTQITLSPGQLPPHSHELTSDNVVIGPNGLHDHDASGDIKEEGNHVHPAGDLETKNAGEHSHQIDLEIDGGGHQHKVIDLDTSEAGLHTHELKDIDTNEAGMHTHEDTFYVGEEGSAHKHPVKIKIQKDGLHNHDFELNTDEEDDHSHGAGWLKTEAAGDHIHQIDQGKTDENGNHTHSFNAFLPPNYDSKDEDIEFSVPYVLVDKDQGYKIITDVAGIHDHNVLADETSNEGVHKHDIKGATDKQGKHDHKVEGKIKPNGLHGHQARADIPDSGEHKHEIEGEILAAGAHIHTIEQGETQAAGNHIHEITGTVGSDDDGEHRHYVWDKTGKAGDHCHKIKGATGIMGQHKHDIDIDVDIDGLHAHDISGKTEDQGDGEPIDITNPYVAVYFICCVGKKKHDYYDHGYGKKDYDTDYDYKSDNYKPSYSKQGDKTDDKSGYDDTYGYDDKTKQPRLVADDKNKDDEDNKGFY